MIIFVGAGQPGFIHSTVHKGFTDNRVWQITSGVASGKGSIKVWKSEVVFTPKLTQNQNMGSENEICVGDFFLAM